MGYAKLVKHLIVDLDNTLILHYLDKLLYFFGRIYIWSATGNLAGHGEFYISIRDKFFTTVITTSYPGTLVVMMFLSELIVTKAVVSYHTNVSESPMLFNTELLELV